jgi:hypothetical protein
MKRILGWLAPLILTASVCAQDTLERPVTMTSTGPVVNVTFTQGSLGYIQDVFLISRWVGCNTGTLYVVNSTIGHTNILATWAFTNNSQNRITSPWPVQAGDIVRTEFTYTGLATNNSTTVWFGNVQH